MGDEPVEIPFRYDIDLQLQIAALGMRYAPFQGIPAMCLDGVGRLGISEHLRRIAGNKPDLTALLVGPQPRPVELEGPELDFHMHHPFVVVCQMLGLPLQAG